MASVSPLHRRKQVLIKKDFQYKFILKFCLVILAGITVSTGLLFLFSQGTLTTSFNDSRLVIKDTGFAILPGAIFTNLITLALITIATIAVTLYVSHKVAGPMFRFEADLKVIGQGDLTMKVRLRQKDQLMEFVNHLNSMTSNLHGKVVDIREGIDQLTEAASKQDAPQELIDGLKELNRKIESNFKL
jgi:methyl-accepting chemotaxis protein